MIVAFSVCFYSKVSWDQLLQKIIATLNDAEQNFKTLVLVITQSWISAG